MCSFIFKLSVCLALVSHVHGYGSGAPIVQCEGMTPHHDGKKPQTTPSPFIAMSETTHGMVGTPMKITLKSNGAETFKGFLVQLRKIESNEQTSVKASGTFQEGTDTLAKTISCNGKAASNAATHNSNVEKKIVNLRWVPSEPGRYKIASTFVKNYDQFWTNIQGGDIIEVHDSHSSSGHDGGSPDKAKESNSNAEFCSTVLVNLTAEPSDADLPYILSIGPVDSTKLDYGDRQKIEQKGLMWINISSEYDTRIEAVALQVRRSKGGTEKMAYGKFILPPATSVKRYHLVDCLGGMGNTIVFHDPEFHDEQNPVSEVNVKWEAPSDTTGDFEVVGSIAQGEYFWNHVTTDKEKSRIRVVKKGTAGQSQSQSSKPGKPGSNSASFLTSAKQPLSMLFLYLFIHL